MLTPFSGKGNSELSLFRKLLSSLSPTDILLFDRYYTGFFDLALIKLAEIDYVSRKHVFRKIDLRKAKKVGKDEYIIELKKPNRSNVPKWVSDE